jgi:hypothetical protein
MFQYLAFLVLGTSVSVYGPRQAHQDSAFIYKTYTDGAIVFEQTSKPGQWNAVNDSVAQLTAQAILRLSNYNKVNYAPVKELNRESVGEAMVFPEPSNAVFIDNPKPETGSKAETNKTGGAQSIPVKEIAFKVIDEQTHFMTAPDGKGKIPYVLMNYYAKGRILVKSEKLDPVTLQPIETSAPVLATR